jgi:hypothetical protein
VTGTPTTCTEHGCVCTWARALPDDEFRVAYSCMVREMCRRAGVSVDQLAGAAERSMDPVTVVALQKIANRFDPENKPS